MSAIPEAFSDLLTTKKAFASLATINTGVTWGVPSPLTRSPRGTWTRTAIRTARRARRA